MTLKRLANLVRHNFLVSGVSSRCARALRRACLSASDQIRRKVWVNGGTVSLDGVTLVLPRDVGVPYLTSIYWNGGRDYEPWTRAVLPQLFLRSRHFVDVGSNIGLYAVLARKINLPIEGFWAELALPA